MSAIVELRDMADNILCDVAQSLDLCVIIQSDYDFFNISNEKKIYIYNRTNVLIGILFKRMFDEHKILKELVDEMFKIK